MVATHPGCKNCDAFPCCGLNILAAKSKDGKLVVVRMVNSGITAVNVTVDMVAGTKPAGGTVSYVVTTLASTTGTAEGPDTDNPIWDPQRHAPVVSASKAFDPGTALTLPPISFQIFTFKMA